MDAHQYGLAISDVALQQGDVLEPVALLSEGDEVELSPLRGHQYLLATLYDALGAQAVGDEVLDGDDLQLEALGDLPELGQARHRPIVVDDLDEGCGGL